MRSVSFAAGEVMSESDAKLDEAIRLLHNRRWAEAIVCLEQVLRIEPRRVEALANLGMANAELGRLEAALEFYDQALKVDSSFVAAHYNRGNALRELRRLDDAVSAYDAALRVQPDLPEAWLNRGLALVKRGRIGEGIASYQQSLRLRPNSPEAVNNLGLALQYLGRLEEAIACFDASIGQRADWADPHCNRAQAFLLKGEFERGWPEYEWRWKLRGKSLPTRPMPIWDGSPLAGRSLLLRCEQGAGDTIQFIRYATKLKQAGAGKVVLEADRRLQQLLKSYPHVDEIISSAGEGNDCDLQVPLLSLPGLFRTNFRTIPTGTPYLHAEPQRIERWKSRLPQAKRRIGIAWQGNRDYPEDHLRSIPLAAFEPLAKLPQTTLVSLQVKEGTEQIAPLCERMPLWEAGPELDAEAAFVDTAAIMMSLDLIVTSDTSIGHLAGALGRPVWLALAYSPEWRWFRDRDDSPWYPTARLFRQSRPGDWMELFERIARELQAGE